MWAVLELHLWRSSSRKTSIFSIMHYKATLSKQELLVQLSLCKSNYCFHILDRCRITLYHAPLSCHLPTHQWSHHPDLWHSGQNAKNQSKGSTSSLNLFKILSFTSPLPCNLGFHLWQLGPCSEVRTIITIKVPPPQGLPPRRSCSRFQSRLSLTHQVSWKTSCLETKLKICWSLPWHSLFDSSLISVGMWKCLCRPAGRWKTNELIERRLKAIV